MNRKIFSSLVIMMVLSIIGITWVQIVWIRNAVNIRNENFNNAVIMSLNNAASEIESLRKINFFYNFNMQDPMPVIDSSSGVTGYYSFGSYVSHNGSGFSININNQNASIGYDGKPDITKKPVANLGDSTFVSDSVSMILTSPDRSEAASLVKNGAKIKTGGGSVYVNQKDFVDWVKKRSNEFQNLSDQMISEIYEWEKTMELDNAEIKSTLDKYFPFYGILTPYEFAILKDGEITDKSSKKINNSEFIKNNYQVRLFPDNIIRKDVVLSVVFPERINYVLGSMTWILGGSMLFSLFIFSTFALSLYFIIRQKKISEMKSDFINNMTHEFKTPIATISLAADTITNPKVINDEISIKHFIGMIKKENNRMNKQVETILQIASLDKKEIEFRFESTSLHAIIERAIETIEIQVQQKQGKIKTEMGATNDILSGDVEHLTSLIHNLLDNAIKYSPEAPDITLRTYNRNDGIVLSVGDKGIGMSKSVQTKIFERFYRQSSGDVHDVKGFGLGLNFVRAIVDAHKGTITVNSEPGKGSIFEIFLPFNWEN
jgi:two-component system, OmpR family, phosphate regulon sensor histidine kinase PhoR